MISQQQMSITADLLFKTLLHILLVIRSSIYTLQIPWGYNANPSVVLIYSFEYYNFRIENGGTKRYTPSSIWKMLL